MKKQSMAVALSTMALTAVLAAVEAVAAIEPACLVRISVSCGRHSGVCFTH